MADLLSNSEPLLLKSVEPDWSLDVLNFVFSIYDLVHDTRTNEERFSWFVSQPTTKGLRAILPNNAERISMGTALFRARPGGIPDERGAVALAYPLAHDYRQNPCRPAGRANYHGQVCLYCADRERTAVVETRLAVAEPVSVCEFATTIELSLVNFDVTKARMDHGATVPERTLGYLACRMAQPADQMMEEKYLLTQMVAQLCRAEKFDGLSYTSVAGGSGKNIALFSEECVLFRKSWLGSDSAANGDHP
jgi:hypothetical protein